MTFKLEVMSRLNEVIRFSGDLGLRSPHHTIRLDILVGLGCPVSDDLFLDPILLEKEHPPPPYEITLLGEHPGWRKVPYEVWIRRRGELIDGLEHGDSDTGWG